MLTFTGNRARPTSRNGIIFTTLRAATVIPVAIGDVDNDGQNEFLISVRIHRHYLYVPMGWRDLSEGS